MQKFLLLAATTGAMGWALTAAQAADIIPEPVCVWCGFHIGVGGGAGYNFYDLNAKDSITFTDDPFEDDPGFTTNLLSNEVDADLGKWYGFGTVEVGYDFAWADGSFVFGILGNYDFNGDNGAEVERNTNVLGPDVEGDGPFGDDSVLNFNERLKVDTGDAWFLGARAGWAPAFLDNAGGAGSSLIYILGGYTWMDASVKAERSINFEGEEIVHEEADADDNVDGWTLGAGIETLLWTNVSLKIEYRHDFLDDAEADVSERVFTFEGGILDGDHIDANKEASVDFSRDTIRGVISWRFGSWW
jgi:outer membrane immunogenic protein